jgi:hypothetical protein
LGAFLRRCRHAVVFLLSLDKLSLYRIDKLSLYRAIRCKDSIVLIPNEDLLDRRRVTWTAPWSPSSDDAGTPSFSDESWVRVWGKVFWESLCQHIASTDHVILHLQLSYDNTSHCMTHSLVMLDKNTYPPLMSPSSDDDGAPPFSDESWLKV